MTDRIPIVLIPGLLSTALAFERQMARLTAFGPVSAADHVSDDSIAAMAFRLLASAPPRFALIGLSMGGYVGFEVARVAPDRLLGLVLLGTTARSDTAAQTRARQSQIDIARADGLEALVDMIFPLIVHPDRSDDVALFAAVRRMAVNTGIDAFVRQQTAIVNRIDYRVGLPSIRCPTLVLVGADDPVLPRDRSAEIADAIPNAQLVVLPRCGHLCPLEQPEATGDALAVWLRGRLGHSSIGAAGAF